ncbi:VOC family protein [Polyangium aurulentum]|uniref:VOC family protein n=1 Tax=Polyangium aurulentum TaxID=2567896 RepID=UPI00146ADCD3|nr:VOC family protein [Polyangium aurulentum]UQA58524.1 VOC family protein [Polyangium aurulentum]
MSDDLRPGVLSHGTLEIKNIQESIRFYRDFLLMRVIHHLPKACIIWLQEGWYIVCVENANAREMPVLNHFGINVDSREAVDRWHERAVREREQYGIANITSPKVAHGSYQFYLKDRDNNWWEFQYDDSIFPKIRAVAGGETKA